MPSANDFETKSVPRIALLGRDYRNVNFELLVAPGDTVRAGDKLMRDARRPQIVFTAPVSGSVVKIDRGPRRRLRSLQREVDDKSEAREFSPPAPSETRDFLLRSGIWTALRTRPFGNIPDPDGSPAALFVTAIEAEIQTSAVEPVINRYLDEFNAAVHALTDVCDAPIYLCHAPEYLPAIEAIAGVHHVAFDGGETSGLPGLHINSLCPIGFNGGEVWHLGYQDVIALGHLLLHRRPWLQRVLTLTGDAVSSPRNLLIAPGAAVDSILDNEIADGATEIRMGPAKFAETLDPGEAFIRAGQRQIDDLA